MIETAFILVPFFALMLGVVDFSLTVFLKSTLQSAVNEGLRYAVSAQTLPGKCQEESIKQVVAGNAMGFLSGTRAKTIAINYYSFNDLSQPVLGPTGNQPGNVVEVVVQNYTWHWLAFGRDPLNISAFAADRMEGRSGSSPQPCR